MPEFRKVQITPVARRMNEAIARQMPDLLVVGERKLRAGGDRQETACWSISAIEVRRPSSRRRPWVGTWQVKASPSSFRHDGWSELGWCSGPSVSVRPDKRKRIIESGTDSGPWRESNNQPTDRADDGNGCFRQAVAEIKNSASSESHEVCSFSFFFLRWRESRRLLFAGHSCPELMQNTIVTRGIIEEKSKVSRKILAFYGNRRGENSVIPRNVMASLLSKCG